MATVKNSLDLEWISTLTRPFVRIALIALIALPLAAFAFALSLSLLVTRSNPRRAIALWPGNSLAHAALADELLATSPTAPPIQARREAIRSLNEQPGNPSAARVLGMVDGAAGDMAGMERWLNYSERRSRRDLITQLALIELAVGRGQVIGALIHYDRALRVFAPQPPLIDVLVHATQEASVRTELAKLLRRRPPWRASYLIQLVESGHASPEAVDAMLRAVRLDPADAFDRRILGEAVALLASHDHVPAARALAGISGSGVRNGDFESGNFYPPLDWKLANEPNLSGVIEQGLRERGGNALFLDVRNDASGTVAEQLLSLAPGRYTMSLVAGGVQAAAPATIDVVCAGRAAPLASAPLLAGPDVMHAFRLPAFVVPADCPMQRLVIAAAASSDAGSTRTWVDDVHVWPAR